MKTSIYLFILLAVSILNMPVFASQISTQWQWNNPALTSNILRDIAYTTNDNSSLAVVVGDHGTIILKSEQQDWQLQSVPTIKSLFSVVWGNNQFVAAGEQGTVITSSDGIHWQVNSINADVAIKKLFWDGHQYIALTDSNIYSSRNAIDWQKATVHLQQSTLDLFEQRKGLTLSLQGITKKDNQFFAISLYGTLLSSHDGLTWQELPRQYEFGTIYFTSIHWNSTYLLITGFKRHPGDSIHLISNDAQQWVIHDNEYGLSNTIWDGEQYIGFSEYDGTLYSAQPENIQSLNWKFFYNVGNDYDIFKIIWTGEKYIASGRNGFLASSSKSGKDFQIHNSLLTNANSLSSRNISEMVWNGEKYLGIKHNCISPGLGCLKYSDTLHISHDGINWRLVKNIDGRADHILWDGHRFVVSNLKHTYFSYDGLEWEMQPSDAETPLYINELAYNGKIYVAIAAGPPWNFYTSDDALRWKKVTIEGNDEFYITALNWNGKQFIATGYYYTLLSSDGINWQQYDAVPGIKAIAWNGSQYLAVGSTGCSALSIAGGCTPLIGKIYSSTDGKDWSLIREMNEFSFKDISWNGEYYTIIGSSIAPTIDSMTHFSFVFRASTINDIIHWNKEYDLKSSEELDKIYWNGRQWLILGREDSVLLGNDGGKSCNAISSVYSSLGNSLLLKSVSVENESGGYDYFRQVRLLRVPGSEPIRFRLQSFYPDKKDGLELCESTSILKDNILYIPKVLVNDEYNNQIFLHNIQMEKISHNGNLDLILLPSAGE